MLKICSAIWSIAGSEREFSCIDNRGDLIEKKWEEYCRSFADGGSDLVRVLPFLNVGDDAGSTDLPEYSGYMPYQIRDGKYDLESFNEKYFLNLRKMAEIANRYGMGFVFSIFDRCHGTFLSSPWRLNHQNVDMWYQKHLHRFSLAWVRRVVDTLKGCDVMWEIENEPQNEGFKHVFKWVTAILFEAGYSRRDIVHGADFMADDFFWKRRLVDPLGPDWRVNACSTVHQVDEEKLQYISKFQRKPAMSAGRRFFISDDGCRRKPDADGWKRLLVPFLKKNPNAFEMEYVFERTNAPYPGEAAGFDWQGCRGVAEAVKEVTGEYPENFGRFPVKPVKEETKEKEDVEDSVDIKPGKEESEIDEKKQESVISIIFTSLGKLIKRVCKHLIGRVKAMKKETKIKWLIFGAGFFTCLIVVGTINHIVG